ncbi:MAG: hypothetical protein ACREUW_03660 [Burkholderiales bacterium]
MHALFREGPWVVVAMAVKNPLGKWDAQCWICRNATPYAFPRVNGGCHYERPIEAIEAARLCGQQMIVEADPPADHPGSLQES